MKIILLSTLILLLTAGSCTKSAEKQLPPATQTGANTFGCLINGNIYKCQGTWTGREMFTDEGVSVSYINGKVGIVALTSTPNKGNFSITFDSPNPQTGVYREGLQFNEITPVGSSDSYIEITKFDDSVISGTFQIEITYQFKDYENDGISYTLKNATRIITEGRFDINRKN